MTSDITAEKLCPYCRQSVVPDDATAVVCDTCGVVHHAECWRHFNHCASQGCTGLPAQTVMTPTPGGLMPPPTPEGLIPPPPPGAFIPPPPPMPYQMEQHEQAAALPVPGISLHAALSNGWYLFQQQMGLMIGALVVYMLVIVASAIIPMASLVVVPVMSGGIMIFGLKALYGRNPAIGDLFAGFNQMGPWLGSYYLLSLIGCATMLPMIVAYIYFIVVMVRSGASNPDTMPVTAMVTLAVCYVISLIITAAVFMRWVFVFFLIAEGEGIMDAMRKSAAMTEGRRLQIFGILFVFGLIQLLGMLLLLVGALFATPLTFCAYTCLYNAFKAERTG